MRIRYLLATREPQKNYNCQHHAEAKYKWINPKFAIFYRRLCSKFHFLKMMSNSKTCYIYMIE